MLNKDDISLNSLDFQGKINELNGIISGFENHLPKQRKPTIIICGKTGNGKTSTINTFFGKEVGNVGDFSRGTEEDEIYEWESFGENINIIDLPGLGDSDESDEIFQEMYRRRIKQADAFIIVIAPPRPAEIGTLKTVKVLLDSGISSKNIIFAYNKLSNINYKNKNGKRVNVNTPQILTGLTSDDADVVKLAKEAFLKDLKNKFTGYSFSLNQIIEYDAGTGWNLHKMFIAAIQVLPYETLFKLERVLRDAEQQILEREFGELIREGEELKKQVEKIKNNQDYATQEHRNEVRILTEEYNNKVKELKRFVEQGKEVKLNMLEIIYSSIEEVLQSVSQTVATQVRRLREGLSSFGEVVQEGINKLWNKFLSWLS